MKLTSMSIVTILIICPFIFISSQQTRLVKEDGKIRSYYDAVIDNAIMDAAFMLSQHGHELSYNNAGFDEAKSMAAQAFFDTVCQAMNALDRSSEARVKACVPVMIFLEQEGYSLYALNSFKNQQGQTEVSHSWFPLEYYIGEILQDRYVVRYTLTNSVTIFDKNEQRIYEGDYNEFKDIIPFYNDSQVFEDQRMTAIRNSVEKSLSNYLEDYNKWSLQRSLSVNFCFPRIDEADWKRALSDEGILVFAQGFPVIMGKSYQHYALGGARIIRKEPLIGYS